MFERFLLPNPRRSELQKPFQNNKVRSGCVLCRSGYHAPVIVRQLPPLLHKGLYRLPLLYGFLLEIHNLIHHMAIRHRRRYGVYWLYFERLSPVEAIEHQEIDTKIRACIESIGNFSRRNPWATIFDLETYRDAWRAGAEWADSNYGKQVLEGSQNYVACGISVSGNESVIPQETKHDQ